MILETQPKSMIVIGAGAIGIEFAYFYNAFGTKVTVVEMLPNALPVEDTEVSQTLEKSLTKQGIALLTNTKTTKTETTDERRAHHRRRRERARRKCSKPSVPRGHRRRAGAARRAEA